jgi:hypothetical protein
MTPPWLRGVQFLCGSALGFTLVTLCWLALLMYRRRSRAAQPVVDWPPIVILRPCEGQEPRLLDNLRSSVTARYPGPRRVRLLVPDEHDPAHAIARQAAAMAPPEARIEILVTGIADTGNRKVAQLERGDDSGPEEILVQADSDVLLGDDNLPELVSALRQDPRCGAAFAPPIEVSPVTWADRASAALVSASQQSFLALYAVAQATGGVPSLAGALCAYRRQALRQIGGFAGLTDILGEDHEVARRLRLAGQEVAITRAPARCTDGGRGLGATVSRVARWLMVVRAQRPGLIWGYPFFLAATPLHLLLSPLLGDRLYLAMALGLLCARALLAAVLRRAQGLGGGLGLPGDWLRGLTDVLLAEGLMWLGLGRCLLHRRIQWRGHEYLVERGGRLVPVGAPNGPARTDR